MRTFTATLKFLSIFLIFPISIFAQNGKVAGKVQDAKTGEALIGVAVFIEGTTIGASTDLDGKYVISNVPAGTVKVTARYVSFKTKVIEGVAVKAGEVTTVNFLLEENNTELVEFEVSATLNRESASVQLMEQKQAMAVSDGISADIIRKTPDNAASDVMKRVSGAAIQDNKFAVIRGLNDRYNAAFINGAPLPSTESDRRAFSFDLFPSNMLDNLVIYKTATPDLPAEFAGGIIQINTREIPEEAFFQISGSAGYNAITTFKNRLYSEGGKTDWLGMDDGTRAMPEGLPDSKTFKAILLSDSNKIKYGRLFKNNWKVMNGNTPLNNNLQVSGGVPFKIFKAQAGFVASLSRSESYRFSEVKRNFYDVLDNNTLLTSYNDSLHKHEVLSGALFNFSVKPGAKSKISFKNSYTINGEDQTIRRRGASTLNVPGSELEVMNTALWYTENRLFTSQLSGEHAFSAWNARIKWTGGYSNIQREIPDFRRAAYNRLQSDTAAPFRLQVGNQVQLEQAGRFFSELNEDIRSAAIDLTLPLEALNGKKLNTTFKAGYYFQERARTFDARQFGYVFRAGPGVPAAIRTYALDSIFSSDRFIFKNGRYFMIEEGTNPNDRYTASSKLTAAYGMFDMKLFEKLRLVYGIRFEEYLQQLEALNATGDSVHVRTLKPDYLPSINATWELTEKSNLRFSASRTLSRPEFREIAPFAFFDFNIDYVIAGNPNLERASIDNYDLRYEFYPGGGQIFSVSAFSKKFSNAIEFINDVDVGAGSRRFGYANVPKAFNYGMELEFRKNFAFLDTLLHTRFLGNLMFIGNFAYIVSEVDLTQFGLASTGVRPLQGQSPYIINTGLQYTDSDRGMGASLMLNRVGRRIAFVGNAAVPNIYENPRTMLDFQLSKKLFNKLDIKLTFSDILAQKQTFYMDLNTNKKFDATDNVIYQYTFGTSVSLGLGLKF
jgi:outer membrane receptor protein involved in Fe transport